MCTVVILRRPGHDWPLILAANRDEMRDRPWAAPGRHWPGRADVTAGLDKLAGGTWLGLNDSGVVASILNRRESLGPKAGFRSRGELPLEALDHADADAAARALAAIEPASYRSFNMVIADNRDAYWIRAAEGRVEAAEIPPGLSLLTSREINDPASARIRLYLPQFEAAREPQPGNGDGGWDDWKALLASRVSGPEDGPEGAMSIDTDHGFATVSSSLLALPGGRQVAPTPVWLFASGAPATDAYEAVEF